MRIILFTKNFGPSFTGATKHTYTLLNQLSRYFDIIVICKHVSSGIEEADFKIVRFTNVFSAISALLKNSSRNDLFYNDDHLVYLLSLTRRRFIHTYHGNWPDLMKISFGYFIKGLYFIPLYIIGFFGSKRVVHVSRYMLNKWKWANRNSRVIYNATYDVTTQYQPVSTKKTLKVICLGNVIPRKYGLLLKLLKSGNSNLLDFHIFGNLEHSILIQELRKYPNVFLHGFSNSINFSDYDLLACFSESENIPLSIIEAMASNLPVASTGVGGISEVINDSNGVIIDHIKNLRELEALVSQRTFSFNDMEVINQFVKAHASNKYAELFKG